MLGGQEHLCDFRADLAKDVNSFSHSCFIKKDERFVEEDELRISVRGSDESLRQGQPDTKHELAMGAVGNLGESHEVVFLLAKDPHTKIVIDFEMFVPILGQSG